MPIFDQGYQHWKGELSGHALRWLAITLHGRRTGMKNRLLRILVIVSWLPAAVLTFVLVLWGMVERKTESIMGFAEGVLGMFPFLRGLPILSDPVSFRKVVWTLSYNTFLSVELFFSMVAVLLVGPGLISQDLRFNAIPSYLSRPVRRIDYFLGKLGTIGYFISMTIIFPSILAWFCGLLFSLDITIIRDTYLILLSAIAYGIVVVLSAGLLMLAMSSLSRRSIYVGIAWLAIWIVSGVTGQVMTSHAEHRRFIRSYERQRQQQRSQAAAQMAKPGQPRPNPGPAPVVPQADQMAEEQKFADKELAEAQSDWRPLFSYTANLNRVGKVLLDTDAAWNKLAEFMPAGAGRNLFLLQMSGYQYPWYWSGGVLAGLMGISVCILNFRVRSLDRLR